MGRLGRREAPSSALWAKVEELADAFRASGLKDFLGLDGAQAHSGGGRVACKERISLAAKCVEIIAGSTAGGALLAKHIAGYDNWTTDSIREVYRQLPGDSKAGANRALKVWALAPLASLSRPAVQRLGFTVGKDLWGSVQEQSKSGAHADLPDHRGGQETPPIGAGD